MATDVDKTSNGIVVLLCGGTTEDYRNYRQDADAKNRVDKASARLIARVPGIRSNTKSIVPNNGTFKLMWTPTPKEARDLATKFMKTYYKLIKQDHAISMQPATIIKEDKTGNNEATFRSTQRITYKIQHKYTPNGRNVAILASTEFVRQFVARWMSAKPETADKLNFGYGDAVVLWWDNGPKIVYWPTDDPEIARG